MRARELSIHGAWEFIPDLHPDARGTFSNPYVAANVSAAVGRALAVAQTNHAVSARGVVRGVHYALVPPGQAKYVYCPHGRALDIVVDVRVGSPTYGRHDVVTLDGSTAHAIYLAEGLGHVVIALADDTVTSYLCSTAYDPDREHGLDPLDPELALPIPRDLPLVLSDRDRTAPTLEQARAAGLLPDYRASVAASDEPIDERLAR